ncbi:MAG TPA: hypothetical protein VLG49_01570 [Rhabdochlamydiaceae bacterium]|nr:hypothetical protein [Rhabdochlamydiaceae bacterium]
MAHLPRPPCASPHFAKSHPRRRGVYNTTTARALRSSAGAILLCDLSRSAARALTPVRAFAFIGRGPLASSRRTKLKVSN